MLEHQKQCHRGNVVYLITSTYLSMYIVEYSSRKIPTEKLVVSKILTGPSGFLRYQKHIKRQNYVNKFFLFVHKSVNRVHDVRDYFPIHRS